MRFSLRTIKSEIKIGFIVVVSLGLFFWGLNFLKGINLLKPSNYYVVTYTHIDGLVKSSPVMLDGFQVGLVRNIEYQYNNPGHVKVTLDLNRKLRLPSGSSAALVGSLLGNPSIELTLGRPESPLLSDGDSLLAVIKPGIMDELTGGLLTQVENMVKHTDSLIIGVETLLNNGNLTNSLASIEQTTDELRKLTVSLNKTIDNDLPGILKNVDQLTMELSGFGKQLNELDLNGTLVKADKAIEGLSGLSTRLNSPDNSLGLLLNDKSLYLNLSNTASSANELLFDLKEHPKRYVHFSLFGGSNK
jgi:phospholipid/cholesterol/gamma-HCH transport system substrate-binding protein